MKKGLLGYYNYTVVLTYLGMLAAFVGVIKAIEGEYQLGIVCLMISGICDMFDGMVASTKERDRMEKNFGIQIDSLSDLISFGVFPAVFVYMITDKSAISALISSLYLLAALIRLAYFNVLEEERQKQTTEKRTSYLGLPVTTVAIMLPAVYLIFDGYFRNKNLFLGILLFCGIFFLLPKEIKKPNSLGKIGLVIIGILEVVGVLFLMGWDSL